MTVDRGDCQRLDTWLWCARLVRTREAAAGLVAEGHVRINGTKTLKPAHPVRRADHLTIVLYGGVRLLEVLDLASRRGGAPAARLLYREPAMRQKEGASPGGTC